MQSRLNENEDLEEENENHENQPIIKSTKKPLKLRNEENAGSANLKSAVREVTFSAPSYFKEAKQDKVIAAADTTFSQHAVNSFQGKKKSVWAGKIICRTSSSAYFW